MVMAKQKEVTHRLNFLQPEKAFTPASYLPHTASINDRAVRVRAQEIYTSPIGDRSRYHFFMGRERARRKDALRHDSTLLPSLKVASLF